MGIPARKTQYAQTHYISANIAYNTPANTTGVQIGTLPAGARIDRTSVLTRTAFNGTTSVALSVGFTGTGTELINATDVRTAAARVDTVCPIANTAVASDQAVYASVAFGGTTGSAGNSDVIVYYIPALV